MKYKLKEHLICVLFGIAILLLAGCIVIAALLEWSWPAIILVVIAVLAVGFMTYAFVYDLIDFNKKKKEFEKNGGSKSAEETKNVTEEHEIEPDDSERIE